MGNQDNDNRGDRMRPGYRDTSGRGDGPRGRDPRYDDSGFAHGTPRDYRARQQDDDDRGFFDRAGDEVRSWFGDEEAESRRARDARDDGYSRYGSDDRNFDRGGTGYGDPNASRARRGTQGNIQGQATDPGYHDWRQRQIDALDKDYDEYRRHHQAKFDSEFASWRTTRQTQRSSLERVATHMEVVGSDGAHIGTVDKVKGDRILLTKTDKDAGGHHHSIPSAWIEAVDDKVKISRTAEDAQRVWRDEERGAMFGGNERDGNDGPHVLNRSFSGTY